MLTGIYKNLFKRDFHIKAYVQYKSFINPLNEDQNLHSRTRFTYKIVAFTAIQCNSQAVWLRCRFGAKEQQRDVSLGTPFSAAYTNTHSLNFLYFFLHFQVENLCLYVFFSLPSHFNPLKDLIMVNLNMHPGASVAGSRDVEAKDIANDVGLASYAQANIRQSHSISLARSSNIQSRQRAASVSGPMADSGPMGSFQLDSSVPNTPPKQRKRLSINFALPVVSSSGSASLTNQSGANATSAKPFSATSNNIAPRRTRPSHAHSASVSLPPLPNMMFGSNFGTPSARPAPTSSNSSTPSPKPNNKHKHSASVSQISNDLRSGASTTSNSSNNSINNSITNPPSNKASAIEYYFSQLAYRERRVVELRDEIKRMELQLRQAEDDLSEFRKHVPVELMPTSSGMSLGTSTPRSSLSRSNTYSATISPPSYGQGISRPFSLESVATLPDEPKRPFLLSSPPGSSEQSPNHSNSLSDTSASSAEVPGEIKHGKLASSASLGGGLPMPPSRSHATNLMYHQNSHGVDGSDGSGPDVFHKGKRVAEEIGTQFWSFLDDIKGGSGEPPRSNVLMASPPMVGNPMTSHMLPQDPVLDAGLPDLAMLQQQHQTQQMTGRSAPMAPPRKPRRKLEQQTSATPLMEPPPMSGGFPKRTSAGMRGPVLGHAQSVTKAAAEKPKGDDHLRGVPESSNSYYLV